MRLAVTTLSLAGCLWIGDDDVSMRTDVDGDGHHWPEDCDDRDETVFPGGAEVCDGRDNDCDTVIDGASSTNAVSWFTDADEDGYGDDTTAQRACTAPEVGLVTRGGDCDDDDPALHPDADERCDAIDQDCDGDDRDPESIDAPTWYLDADSDGYGSSATTTTACDRPEGFVAAADDCDDADPEVHPDHVEVCGDQLDNDCDGGPGPCVLPASVAWVDTPRWLALPGAGTALATVSREGSASRLGAIGHASGVTLLDLAGSSVDLGAAVTALAAGDVDGDLFQELVVGDAPGGVVHVLPGVGALTGLGDAIGRWTAETAGDRAGAAIVLADLTGDGADELCIGAPGADSGGTDAGAVYLVRGTAVATTSSLAAASARIAGIGASGATGTALATGDLDGDGQPELVIGGPYAAGNRGGVWVFAGSPSGALSVADADAAFDGPAVGTRAGAALALGDLDGDGYADLVVGGPGARTNGTDAGAVWVVHGPALSELASADATWLGRGSGDLAGSAIAVLGDVDGDGRDDVAIGAPGGDGAAFLLIGPGAGTASLAAANTRVEGPPDGGAGTAIAGGDLNGDGLADLVIGAPGAGLVGVLFGTGP